MIISQSFREYGFIGSLYCVTVGFLYQWGYWSSVGINVLAYVSLTDVVSITLIPFLTSVLAFCIGALLSVGLPNKIFPEGGGAETPVGRFLHKHSWWIGALYFQLLGLIYFFGPVEKWRVLPILLAVPFSLMLRSRGVLRDLVSHDDANRGVLLILCVLPFSAYGHGILDADTIIRGQSYQYLEVTTKKTKMALEGLSGVDTNTKLRFLGFMNNYVFLMPLETKTVIVTKFDSLDPIALQEYPKKN